MLRAGGDEPALRRYVKKQQADIAASALEKELSRLRGGLEVTQTLKELSLLGVEARYYPCDVAQAEAVRQALDQVVSEWGRIDLVIHGAGVIHDSFMAFMTPEDFSRVAAVKLTGAANLLAAAKPHGPRPSCCRPLKA